MDFQKLKKITDLFQSAGLTELELIENDEKLVLKKALPVQNVIANAQPQPAVSYILNEEKAQNTAVSAETTQNAAQEPPAAVSVSKGTEVKSPLAGVLYLSPSPNDKPFASVGDTVKAGAPLCIIEAMKVMNEIAAPKDGKVVRVYGDNEQIVEFGQVLFVLE